MVGMERTARRCGQLLKMGLDTNGEAPGRIYGIKL